jgi:hypothetical protein
MPRFRRNAAVSAVIRAKEEGDRCHQSRDAAGAIAQYERGCRLVREILAADPADAQSVQQLAAMLYLLGQWQRDAGLRAEAVSSLDEAEELYKRLGGQATPLVADVVIRRANVRAELGAPLSAIEDVQQAVVASTKWGQQDPSRELDVARVIGIAASVQLSIGADPDLACAAADWALMTYQERLAAGGKWSIPPAHAFAVRSAARVAAITHTAAGRSDLAGPTRSVATELSGGSWPDFEAKVAVVRDEQPTLAHVLRTAGREDLASRITAPITSSVGGLPLVPEMRGNTRRLLATAGELAGVQAGDLPGRARMLLGLEAHAMFAAASRQQVPEMRYQFGDSGPHWARAVLTTARLMNGLGERPGVRDAIGWLVGICQQLQPFALIDPATRSLVKDCLRWSRDIHAEEGSADAVSALTAALKMLDALPG